MNKLTLLLIVLAVIVLVAVGFWYWRSKEAIKNISSFEECGALYPVMESYPARCVTPDGRSFTQEIGNELEKHDLIQITNPRPGQTISHKVSVTGQARGTWYFEASFPIRLVDSSGQAIATTHAEARGEWMTERFVPFAASFTIPSSFHGKATLVLEKDNPSGLPEQADRLRVPVVVE